MPTNQSPPFSLSFSLCSRGANDKVAFLSLGCEVDGTLHVRAIKADGFVASAAAALSPGDELRVHVKDVDVERRKVRLTMLEHDAARAYDARGRARATLDEVAIDCEADRTLWGEARGRPLALRARGRAARGDYGA